MKVSVVEQSLSIASATCVGWKLAQEMFLSDSVDIAKRLSELRNAPPDTHGNDETPYFKGIMPRDVGLLIGKLLINVKPTVLLLSDEHVYILKIDDKINDHHIIDVMSGESFSFTTIDTTGPAFFQGRITKKIAFVAYLMTPPPAVVVTPTPVPPVAVPVVAAAAATDETQKKKRVMKKPKVEEDEKIE